MARLFWLSDEAWGRIEPHPFHGRPGKPRVDDRQAIGGILHALKVGCAGATDATIAAGLGLSPNTVRNRATSPYRKIGVNRRSAVVVWARERGI